MKSILMLVSLVLFAFSAEANWQSLVIDGEDTIQGVLDNPKFKKNTVKSKLKVDYRSQIAAIYSDSEDFQCADKDIAKVKVTSPTGIIFYMIYTTEDYLTVEIQLVLFSTANSKALAKSPTLRSINKIDSSSHPWIDWLVQGSCQR